MVVPGIAPKKAQAEMRLVAEWLRTQHGDDYTEQRVRLGSMPLDLGNGPLDPMEAKLVHSVYARWADAIVIRPDVVRLVEGKIIAHPVAIAQLQLYARLLPFTPGIRVNPAATIEMVLVYAKPDDLVLQMAHEAGITTELFDPPWVEEYINTRLHRQRQGSRSQLLTDATDVA
jgi:hypothetical protein